MDQGAKLGKEEGADEPRIEMKIALLSYEYPPDTGFGGIGTYTYYQARGLAKLGHDVHVLAGATAVIGLRSSEQDGVIVHRYRHEGAAMSAFRRLGPLKLRWTRNRLENAVSMYHGLKALMWKERFDVVEMPECGAEGALLTHWLEVPTVMKFHSPARLIMPYYDLSRADRAVCAAVEQAGIRGARSFAACSRFLADSVERELHVNRPVRVIPNGIDLNLFDNSPQIDVRRKFDLPADRPMILFSGRMERRKGIHLCAEIARAILNRHEVAMVFVGQDLFQYMAEVVIPSVHSKRLKGSFHYLGKLDLPEVRACLMAADIFLMPSLWENCPYSCLEAMAAGCAVVASDQGGMPELIRHGENGLLARSGEPQGFVEALERLLGDSHLRARLGAAARRTIEEAHLDTRIARQSIDYYGECMHKAN